ncbi:MAG: DUF2029 domain-containing protein [Acidobacteria bacterium]|nr:DUF2029 domain-containing protein [Acidobacteriota bacterium]
MAWQARRPISLGQTDFIGFYTAGQLVSQGKGVELFVGPLADGSATYPNAHLIGFTHAPYEALLYVPFAYLSYAPAAWLWCILSILVANVCIFLLLPEIPAIAARPDLAILAVGLFMPVMIAEFNGQDSLLTLLLFCLCFKGLMRNQVVLAGSVLACATLKLPLMIPMFLMIVATTSKRWRFVGGFAATGSILSLLSIAAVSWEGVSGYPAFLRRYSEHGDRYHVADMPNLRGIAVRLMEGRASESETTVVVFSLSMLAVVFAIWVCRRSGNETISLQFALCVTTTILVGYHEYAYDLVLLILPIFAIWNWFLAQPQENRKYKWIPTALALLVLGSPAASLKPSLFSWEVVLIYLFLFRLLWTAKASQTAGDVIALGAV